MGVYVDVIAEQSLGTGTSKVQLSGNPTANAAGNYIVPANCKGLLFVEPYLVVVTPTISQSTISSMKIEADDLGIKDYEVFAAPVAGIVPVTPSGSFSDLARTAVYPLMFPTLGGESVSFFGINQVAPTAAPFMGASLWWTDDPGQLTDLPFRAKIGGAAGGAASTTSTGTTANGLVTGTTLTLSGQAIRTIRSLTGVLADVTVAAVKPVSGYFVVTSGEMAYVQRYTAEPIHGLLGSTDSNYGAHLTRADNLSCIVQPPTTVSLNLWLSQAPSTAGLFALGMLYN